MEAMEAISNVQIKCGNCATILLSVHELKVHYRERHAHLALFKCGHCEDTLVNKTSLVRHITNHIRNQDSVGGFPGDSSSTVAVGRSHFRSLTSNVDVDVDVDDPGHDGDQSDMEIDGLEAEAPEPIDLNDIAAKVILDLRSKATLTGKALERFQDGCTTLLQNQHADVMAKVCTHLRGQGMSETKIEELVIAVGSPDNVFSGLRTIEDQLETFATKYGLVPPKEFYLGSRVEKRLDPKTNLFIDSQVPCTFQSVSIIETLKAVLSNKNIRNNIFKDLISRDGVLRSYVDGSDFKDHPFLRRHNNVIHILLFYDELETVNVLMSRTSIHKLGVFFFQVLNLPAHLCSKLSSIYLLALAYAEDLKKPGAFKKVLTPLIQDMKKLASEEGVQMLIDGEVFILRAVLVAVTADTLAAHDLLGFLGPSAKFFCRLCMISRKELRENANSVGQPRTKEAHDQQVAEVARHGNCSSLYGVRTECALNEIPFFHCIDGNVFDAFHDLLEGIVPLVTKMVMRHFIRQRKLLTISDFNQRVASFSYGLPDQRNKPSANFVLDMLQTNKKFRQKGSQMWCLFRALPFLLWGGIETNEEDSKHMEIVFLLQDIMKIIFAFEVNSDDLDRLDTLIFKHHDLFKTLYIDTVVVLQDDEEGEQLSGEEGEELEEGSLAQEGEHEQLSGEEEESEDGEQDVDGEEEEQEQSEEEVQSEQNDEEEQSEQSEEVFAGPAQKAKKKKFTIHFINKFHHLTHYSHMIRRYGPAVRMWCAKFEGRLKIFRQHAAIVCNFTKVTKTMADMYQLSNVILDCGEEPSVEFHKGMTVKVSELDPNLTRPLALEDTEELLLTNSAIINGEEYRPGLFVVMSRSSGFPQYALIIDVYVHKQTSVFLSVKPWKVECLSAKYNCHRVCPDERPNKMMVNALLLNNFRAISPWSVAGSDSVYLSVRTIVL